MSQIPVMRPIMPEVSRVVPRLEAIGRSRTYSNFGPQVIELEERLAQHMACDPRQVVTCSSATAGLIGAVTLSDTATWMVPSFTFTATPAAVLAAGKSLHWWDIEPTTWWADGAPISDERADGLLPVAPFGAAVDLRGFSATREVIVDAAASTGADNPALSDLPPTWAAVFSLHATKVLPAGEGGFVVFGDPERARLFRSWTNFGFAGTRESQIVGTNAKMSEHTAAWAHASLDGWSHEQEEWAAARALVRSVADELGLEAFEPSDARAYPYWIASFASAVVRDRVERVLSDVGVGTRRWWGLGCHLMPAYRGVPDAALPSTANVASRYLGLPLYRGLTKADVTVIARGLSTALRDPG